MADVEIKGLSELLAAMRQLPREIAGKALADPVLKAARVIRQAAKRQPPGQNRILDFRPDRKSYSDFQG